MSKKTQNSANFTSPPSTVDASIGFSARGQSEIASALQKAILSSAFFSSIATDAKGVIQLFNPGAERMLGYSAAEVVNKLTPADLSDAQELTARAQALSAELSTPIRPGFEALVFKASRGVEDIYGLTYIRKDGSRLPAVVSVTALRDAQDAILGYLLVGTDNTVRSKQTERERDILASFPSENPNPIIRIARDGTLLYINPQGRQQLPDWHLSEGKAAPLNLRKVVLESFNANKVLKTDLNYGERVFSFFVAPFAASGYANLYATDITERKQAEYELKERIKELTAIYKMAEIIEREGITLEEIVRETVNILPDGWQYPEIAYARIVIGDSEFCTKNFKETAWAQSAPVKVKGLVAGKVEVGYTEERPEEDEGPFFKEERLLINTIAERLEQVIERIQEEKEKGKADEKIRQLNRELERRVKDRTAQLAAANEELEAFAYSVSHDLRAPLRAMDGFSTALKNSYPDKLDEQGQHYLARIQAASLTMGQLIDDLLNLSRVTRSELKQQEIDLGEMAREIAGGLKMQFPERQVVFEISAKMKLTGDANLFKIVLENLINNAWKFTSARAQALIEVGMQEQNGRQVYFVRDNGVGFDMVYTSKLFIPFQRLHSSHEFPGTGIGLVTVKRIITRHGGHIWAEAGVDQGAVFYFTIGGN